MKEGNIHNVIFDSVLHVYMYEGKLLKGITRTVSEVCGKSFPETHIPLLSAFTSFGNQVHKEVERWIKEGISPETEAGKWVSGELTRIKEENTPSVLSSEVLVSDFEGTASQVDVVLYTGSGAYLFDIKTGVFDRKYCTDQLSVYKVLFQWCYKVKVLGLYVLASKSKRVFKIIPCDNERVLYLLEKNKEE